MTYPKGLLTSIFIFLICGMGILVLGNAQQNRINEFAKKTRFNNDIRHICVSTQRLLENDNSLSVWDAFYRVYHEKQYDFYDNRFFLEKNKILLNPNREEWLDYGILKNNPDKGFAVVVIVPNNFKKMNKVPVVLFFGSLGILDNRIQKSDIYEYAPWVISDSIVFE